MYKQRGPNHSPRELVVQTVKQTDLTGLPLSKMCLGLPFYDRKHIEEGDWVTYEDLVQQHELSGREDTQRSSLLTQVTKVKEKMLSTNEP